MNKLHFINMFMMNSMFLFTNNYSEHLDFHKFNDLQYKIDFNYITSMIIFILKISIQF
jgi:hypothetical protein